MFSFLLTVTIRDKSLFDIANTIGRIAAIPRTNCTPSAEHCIEKPMPKMSCPAETTLVYGVSAYWKPSLYYWENIQEYLQLQVLIFQFWIWLTQSTILYIGLTIVEGLIFFENRKVSIGNE